MIERSFILNVIESIRDSHKDMEYLYSEGQCYNFHKILKAIVGDIAECWYDYYEGHIYTKINEFWYDIRGEHSIMSENCYPINIESIPDHPENWSGRDTRRLVDLAMLDRESCRDLSGMSNITIGNYRVKSIPSLWDVDKKLCMGDIIFNIVFKDTPCRVRVNNKDTS